MQPVKNAPVCSFAYAWFFHDKRGEAASGWPFGAFCSLSTRGTLGACASCGACGVAATCVFCNACGSSFCAGFYTSPFSHHGALSGFFATSSPCSSSEGSLLNTSYTDTVFDASPCGASHERNGPKGCFSCASKRHNAHSRNAHIWRTSCTTASTYGQRCSSGS